MKKILNYVALPLLFACNSAVNKAPIDTISNASVDSIAAPPTVKSEQLIRPGEGIGQLAIGMPVDSAIALLKRPDSSDAAMGSTLMVWYSKDNHKYRTAVFAGMSEGNETVRHIKRIMVSSPWFKTNDNLAVGASLPDIQQTHRVKKVDDNVASQKGLVVFDDNEAGITFDIDSTSNKCVAITVHKKGEGTGSYINMH
jgi:hypothetical protein